MNTLKTLFNSARVLIYLAIFSNISIYFTFGLNAAAWGILPWALHISSWGVVALSADRKEKREALLPGE